MVAALFSLALSHKQAPVLDLTPTDDVWVYEHASDPAGDTYLRVWGSDGRSTGKTSSDQMGYSYGFLRFDLSKIPAGAKLAGAKLYLTQNSNPTFTLDQAKKYPLEVRPMVGTFTEKDWRWDQIEKTYPTTGEKDAFGHWEPDALAEPGKELRLEIDLMKGPNKFEDAIKADSKSICLALCSTISPADTENRPTYKVFSKEADAAKRPILHLTFASGVR